MTRCSWPSEPGLYFCGFSWQQSRVSAGSDKLQRHPAWGGISTHPGRRRRPPGQWGSPFCQLNHPNLPPRSITLCCTDLDIWLLSNSWMNFQKDIPSYLTAEGDEGQHLAGVNTEIIVSVGATHSTWVKETKWSRTCNLKCHERPESEFPSIIWNPGKPIVF